MEYTRLSEIDLKANINERIYASFLVLNVEVKPQKGNKRFLMFNMVDKDTVLESKIFDVTDEIISKVISGRTYYGAIDIKPWEKAPNGISGIVYNMDFADIKPEYFVDWADNLDESQKIIEGALAEIGDNTYRKIVYPILIERWGKFSSWSAASGQHHTRLGDLLTHTAEVVTIVSELADIFNNIYGSEFINKPLLLSAALLHDVGKTEELDVDTITGETKYSKNSVLKTHIMDVLSMVDIQAYRCNIGIQTYEINEINEEEPVKSEEEIADELECLNLLKHCLAAHHGKLEWGSPITPSVPEAHLLHIADNLDAEMFKYYRTFRQIESGEVDVAWQPSGIRKTYKDSTK
mgnify:FL=1